MTLSLAVAETSANILPHFVAGNLGSLKFLP